MDLNESSPDPGGLIATKNLLASGEKISLDLAPIKNLKFLDKKNWLVCDGLKNSMVFVLLNQRLHIFIRNDSIFSE